MKHIGRLLESYVASGKTDAASNIKIMKVCCLLTAGTIKIETTHVCRTVLDLSRCRELL